MTESVQKLNKKPKRLTKAEAKTLELVRADPLASNYEIGKQLQQLGVDKTDRQIYHRLKQKEYINGEIELIRDNNAQYASRLIVPKSLKIHENVLKNKNIPDIEKKDWVKMGEALEFRMDDNKRVSVPQIINFTEVRAIINQTINTDTPQDVVVEGD